MALLAMLAAAPVLSAPVAEPIPVPPPGVWELAGYRHGERCGVNTRGSSRAGDRVAGSCTPFTQPGISKYSFDGSGFWKLCLYNNQDGSCGAPTVAEVNGGRVICLDEVADAYKVVAADTPC
jgi:hypothetical protein